MSEDFNYEIIGFKGNGTKVAEYKGYVNVILAKSNNNWVVADAQNFSKIRKVFIKNYFDTIPVNELFLFKVQDAQSQSYYNSEDGSCEFESRVQKNSNDQYILDKSNILPKELIEIIDRKMPSNDSMVILLKKEPMTEYVLIKDEAFYYGLFKWEILEQELEDVTIQLKWFEPKFMGLLKNDVIYKIKESALQKYIISFKDDNEFDCDILNNFTGILSRLNGGEYCEEIDCISTENLISYGLRRLDEITKANPVLKSFVALIRQPGFDNHIKNTLKNSHDYRLKKFLAIANSLNTDISNLTDGAERINDVIKELVISNPNIYGLPELINSGSSNEIEELELNIQSLQEEQDKLHSENKQISELNSKLEHEYKEILREKDNSERLDAKIKDKEEKLKELEDKHGIVGNYDEIRNFINKHDPNTIETKFYTTQDVYDKQIKKLETEKTNLKNECQEFEDKIKTLTDGFETKVRQKLLEVKPYVDYINGNFGSSEIELKQIAMKYNKLNNDEDKCKLIVSYIKRSLINNNRHYEDWQIANLLICLQQSFLTIFAGLPGTGKTSLSRLLISAQGIEKRSKEIAVSRGWTSEKDLIGFYNPLISQFQPSNTGLYGFLLSLFKESQEVENGNISEVGMAYVILDEANLSPMEHYWSKFMGMTDKTNKPLQMNLGDIASIPNNLRFIATINYDATTEMLSPRVIDRAPIIVLDYNQRTIINQISELLNQDNILPISATEMEELFGRSSQNNADFTTTREKEAFNELKVILNDSNSEFGLPIYISHRKEQSIKEYCAKASSIVYDEESPLRSLDLAFLQFVLPQIKGHGSQFIKRIEKLQDSAKDYSLDNTSTYLDKMIKYAKSDFETVDFFFW